jgi:Spy/CpxP family protein refolding chaperone
MRRIGLWVIGILLLAALPVLAKPAETAPGGSKDMLRGEYALMVTELKLTEAQQTQLREKVQGMQTAVSDWMKQHKEQLDKFNTDMKAAREAKDKEAQKKLTDEMKPLQAERSKLEAEKRQEIMALLTPEQTQAWAAFKLQQEVLNHLKRVNLSEEQIGKIKPLCAKAATEMNALPAEDRKGREKLKGALVKSIQTDILNEDQRALLAAPKAEKPAEKPKEQAGDVKK